MEKSNSPVLVIYGSYVGIQTMGGVFGDEISNTLKNSLIKTNSEIGVK